MFVSSQKSEFGVCDDCYVFALNIPNQGSLINVVIGYNLGFRFSYYKCYQFQLCMDLEIPGFVCTFFGYFQSH